MKITSHQIKKQQNKIFVVYTLDVYNCTCMVKYFKKKKKMKNYDFFDGIKCGVITISTNQFIYPLRNMYICETFVEQ